MKAKVTTLFATLALAGGVLAAGCGTATVATTGTQASASASTPSSAKSTTPAHIGTAIVLKTNDNTSLRVRILAAKWSVSVKADEWATDHNVEGVQVEIVNVGSAVYSDSPSNCASLIDAVDQGHEPSWTISTPGTFQQVTIAPGDRRVGWLWFDHIAKSQAKAIQFTPDSGFASETGQWLLKL
ncbi:MAG: hypothetical protein ACLQUT_06445 [Thermoleophilia bacterium]